MALLPSSQPKVSIVLVLDGKRFTKHIPTTALRSLDPAAWGELAKARTADLVKEAGL